VSLILARRANLQRLAAIAGKRCFRMNNAAAVSAFRKLGLTRREADVLLWITRGQSNTEIGASLSISPLTVKKHLEHVFRKLGVRSRLAAAVLVAEAPSVSPRALSRRSIEASPQMIAGAEQTLRQPAEWSHVPAGFPQD
jgi:DNA-binding CsgD family transcriptional regulator